MTTQLQRARNAALARPELVLLAALVLGCAFLSKGLPLGITLLGVVSGCLLALHAMGIVLLYARTRILSFAQFGLGAGAANLFFAWVNWNQWAVLAQGVCGCLAPDRYNMGDLQHHPDLFREYLLQHHAWVLVANAVLSAVIALGFAMLAGLQVFGGLSWLFSRAPAIVPTIVTLALALSLAASASQLLVLRTVRPFGWHLYDWWPYGPRVGTGVDGKDPLPEGRFESPKHDALGWSPGSGLTFHVYDWLIIASAVAALVYLVLRFRVGRRGLLSRAAAVNIERSATLGVDVVAERRGPWVVAGALSGLAGILSVLLGQTAPGAGLDINALTLVLAAVVLARLTSLGWALVATVLLSVLDQGLFWNLNSHTQFQGGLVVLIGVALVIQRGRKTRAERDAESVFTSAAEPLRVPDALRRQPGVHGLLRGTTWVVLAFAVGLPLLSSPSQLSLAISMVTVAVVGLSLLVLSGWGGQVSLGQLGFGAVGGYVAAVAGVSWHVPMPVALVLGAVAAAVVAPLVGFPALRLPGPFVAIMTLAFSIAVPAVLLNPDLLGDTVPREIDRPVLLGLDLGSDRYFYWFSLLVLLGALAIVSGLRRTRLRRALIASRDNEQAVSALGVDVTRLRLEAFAVSGFVAGLGGGLIAYANGNVAGYSFSSLASIGMFLIVVIGGLSAVSGPVLGAVLYGFVTLAGTTALTILNGLGALLILAFRPGGVAGFVTSLRDAAIRVIMHLRGSDLIRLGGSRIAIADRGARAPVVPVQYRMVGTGYGPVEGTRLRSVEGVADTTAEDGVLEVVTEEPAYVLSCHRLDVSYGGSAAVSGVSLGVVPGEVLAIVGLNGAGKTSLLRALAGLEPAAHGTVEIDGVDATTWFPHVRAQAGIAFVPGGSAVLGTLTVRENLLVAGATEEGVGLVCDRFPTLAARIDAEAGNLSGGEQQLLAIAQSFARAPRVLLVDELSLGLSPEALEAVLEMLRELSAAGCAVILVEQSISTAIELADTAVFLEGGRVRYQGPASSLRDHPELFASVAFGAGGVSVGGGSELARARKQQGLDRELVLRVEDLSAGYGDVVVVDQVTLDVAPGEVVGILGPNGAGKTSLFDALSGILTPTQGTVTLLGNDITALAPHKRAELGLSRSFQNVRLFPSLTVRDCIAVALETRLTVKSPVLSGLWLPPARAEERRVDERVDVLLELLRLEPLADTQVGSLSLGSRRMVDLACQLAARPKVLLLDEPAAGLAAGETELLGPLVSRISSDLDCAVLIIEHNVQVLASVADRLVAMRSGAVIAQGPPSDVLSDPEVRGAYFGGSRELVTA